MLTQTCTVSQVPHVNLHSCAWTLKLQQLLSSSSVNPISPNRRHVLLLNFQKLQAKKNINIQHKKCEESSHVFSSLSHNRVDFNCAAKARRRAVILSVCAAAVTLRCTRSPGPMTAQPLRALSTNVFPLRGFCRTMISVTKNLPPLVTSGEDEFSPFVSSSSSSLTVRAVDDTLVSSVLVSGQTG